MATCDVPGTLRRIAPAVLIALLAIAGASPEASAGAPAASRTSSATAVSRAASIADVAAAFGGSAAAATRDRVVSTGGGDASGEPLSGDSLLHLDGIGPIRLGMTIDEAREAAGVPTDLEEGPYCTSLHGRGELDNVTIVATDRESERVDLVTVGSSPIRTDEGVMVGSTVQEVLAAYAGRVEVVGLDQGAGRLIVRDGGDVLVLDVDGGVVAFMAIGQPALLDEACA